MAVRGSGTAVTEPIVGIELIPLADEPEEVRVGVEKVRDALLLTFYSGTGSPYLPADPAAVELWARQLYGFGMRLDDTAAKEMPIVPAWMRASAEQQFVEVTAQIDVADGTIPAGVATVGVAPPLPDMAKPKRPAKKAAAKKIAAKRARR